MKFWMKLAQSAHDLGVGLRALASLPQSARPTDAVVRCSIFQIISLCLRSALFLIHVMLPHRNVNSKCCCEAIWRAPLINFSGAPARRESCGARFFRTAPGPSRAAPLPASRHGEREPRTDISQVELQLHGLRDAPRRVCIICADKTAALVLKSGPEELAVEPCSGACREAIELYFSTPPERWRAPLPR
jgi:hypothetical protein